MVTDKGKQLVKRLDFIFGEFMAARPLSGEEGFAKSVLNTVISEVLSEPAAAKAVLIEYFAMTYALRNGVTYDEYMKGVE